MKILIAEDDRVVRRVIQAAVERFGHSCATFGDGEEAWTGFLEFQPDVILSDWMMPGIDGVELTRRVRAHPGRGYSYIILLTALEGHENALEGMVAGADDYLRKPLDARELETRLVAAERVTALHAELAERERQLKSLTRSVANAARRDRAVLDTSNDAFVSIDEKGRIAEWNASAESLFGWAREEALGRPFSETVIPEPDRDRVPQALGPCVDGSASAPEMETEFLHRDGHRIPVALTPSPLVLDGTRVMNAFVRDISERRRSEQYRAAQLRVSKVLAEGTDVGAVRQGVVAALGETLGWDIVGAWGTTPEGGLEAVAAWGRGELADGEFARLSQATTIGLGEGLPQGARTTREPVWFTDAIDAPGFIRRDAAIADGLHTGVFVPVTNSGTVVGMIELFSRERREPDEALLFTLTAIAGQVGQYIGRRLAMQETQRLKDEFSALVSHELRTPLTSILGYLEIVLEQEHDEQTSQFLEVVDRNARRLLRLVGDLLFVAQVEAGKLALETGSIDIAALAAEAVEAAAPAAESANVSLRLDAGRLPITSGDAGRVGQALDNLISNAVKFTPAGGSVTVCVAQEGSEAVVEVSDTGIGIGAAEQERLFERFFRATTARESATPGVGLGLAITQAIVEGHGGAISVESEEGAGTTFRLTLPLTPVEQAHDYSPRQEVTR